MVDETFQAFLLHDCCVIRQWHRHASQCTIRRSPTRSPHSGDANSRATAPALTDPIIAIERDYPRCASMEPLFDSFARQVRNASSAGRLRAGHVAAFRAT